MKNFFSIIVLMGIICWVSCQENIPTDPITNLSKPTPPIIRDKIPICCEVCDPLSGTCRLNGCVEYTHQIIDGPENPDGLYTIKLNLQMLSKLCDRCMMMHPEWLIRGNNEIAVTVSEEGITLIPWFYDITNRFDVAL